MDRWIICWIFNFLFKFNIFLVGITVCHSALLSDTKLVGMYHKALQHGQALRLFRDESILVFPMIQTLLSTIKSYNKKMEEIKELSIISLETW